MSKRLSLFLALLLTNCSIISYSELIPLAKLAIVGAEDIIIDDNFIRSKQFSFAKVKIGRSAIAIFSLVRIDQNGAFEWISGEGEILTTFNGKIIKLENSLYNTEFMNFSNFNPSVLTSESRLTYDLFLSNPRAFITQDAFVEISSEQKGLKIEETVQTNGFKWEFKNKYVFNSNNRAIHSIQTIHPKVPTVEIDFYYK